MGVEAKKAILTGSWASFAGKGFSRDISFASWRIASPEKNAMQYLFAPTSTSKKKNDCLTTSGDGEIQQLDNENIIPPMRDDYRWGSDSSIHNALCSLMSRLDTCHTELNAYYPMTVETFGNLNLMRAFVSKMTARMTKGIFTCVALTLNVAQNHWVPVTMCACSKHPNGCAVFADPLINGGYGPNSKIYQKVKKKFADEGIICRCKRTMIQGDGHTCA